MKRRDFIAAAAAIALPAPAAAAKQSQHRLTTRKSPLPSRQRKTGERRKACQPPGANQAKPASPRHRCRRSQRGRWRTYDLATRIEIRRSAGISRLWLPLAMFKDTPGSVRSDIPGGAISSAPASIAILPPKWRCSPPNGGMASPATRTGEQGETRDRHFDVTKKHCAPGVATSCATTCAAPRLMPLNDKTREIARAHRRPGQDPVAQGKGHLRLGGGACCATRNRQRSPPVASIRLNNWPMPSAVMPATRFSSSRSAGQSACPRAGFGLRCDYSRIFPSLGATGRTEPPSIAVPSSMRPVTTGFSQPADLRQAVLEEKLSPGRRQARCAQESCEFGFWK